MSSQLKLLRTYAELDDASIAKLPPTVYFSHTEYTLTIFDAYPKALFHFLVLPRILQTRTATTASVDTTDTTAVTAVDHHVCPTGDCSGGGGGGGCGYCGYGQGFARSHQGVVVPPPATAAATTAAAVTPSASVGDLTNLRTLLLCATGNLLSRSSTSNSDDDIDIDDAPSTTAQQTTATTTAAASAAAALSTLRVLADEAARVRREIEREMERMYRFTWDVWIGFHAVPSMEHLHLHVISSDLIAPGLKTKRHYNSFSPRTGFFIPLADVLHDHESILSRLSPEVYEARLKGALVCFRCGERAKNMPSLKKHLRDEFDRMGKRGSTIT